MRNEDVTWQRLKDAQLESENRRLLGASPPLFQLARRFWRLVVLAMPISRRLRD
jgi:hypothetical protein